MAQLGLEPRSPTSYPSARHAEHIVLSSRHLTIRPPGLVGMLRQDERLDSLYLRGGSSLSLTVPTRKSGPASLVQAAMSVSAPLRGIVQQDSRVR